MLQPRGTWEYEISAVNLGENLFIIAPQHVL